MRARLHVHGSRIGFYREGTHELCDAIGTGQLLESTHEWIRGAQATLQRESLEGLAAIEVAENVDGTERACHLDLHAGVDEAPFVALAGGLTGLSAQRADRPDVVMLAGQPVVTDVLRLREEVAAPTLALRRSARAFFQGNRFLLERLLWHVLALVTDGPTIDLYAGGGLFGLGLAASNVADVTLVEGDPVGAADLLQNAQPFRDRVRVERRSVEAFLGSGRGHSASTVIVDPPRTGLSKDAASGIMKAKPGRLVYVSCDVATLARDARVLMDGGYHLGQVTGLDLFPNTAHVETVVQFTR
jgi:23S rRNA (uracil1939-C5)-methyltransferase